LATEQIKIRSSQQIRFSWGKIAGEKAEGQIARGKAGGRAGENSQEKSWEKQAKQNVPERMCWRVGAGEH
jgi:hypothetical protein